jgi:predicted DsbA family dithiol-disulfide isomerase
MPRILALVGPMLGLAPGVMQMAEGGLSVWYDFLCPFARIGTYWLRNAEAAGAIDREIAWKTFSLEQINLPEDGDADELWRTASDRRSLLPSAAAKWAEAQGGDELQRVQHAFFEARHVDKKKIGRPEVTAEVLTIAGFDGSAALSEILEVPKWLEQARADHEEGAALGVFGVPTLVFEGRQPVFLRLLEVPDEPRSAEIYGKVAALADDPLVHEFKRPTGAR